MAIGNPWGAAAQSYGQDVDQLTKIQMGGMQQAAQMPLQLYDRFMDGYEKARQRAAQERAEELRQAQLDRQNRIADETMRHNQEAELFNRNRLAQQDEIAAMDRSRSYLNEVDETFTGTPQEVQGISSFADANKLKGVKEYLQSRLVKGKPEVREAIQGEYPGEGVENVTPAIPESYRPGTKYQLKASAQAETERRNRAADSERELNRLRMEKQGEESLALRRELGNQSNDTRLLVAGMLASDRKGRESEKRSSERAADEAKLTNLEATMSDFAANAKAIKEHKNLDDVLGVWGAVSSRMPSSKAFGLRANIDKLTAEAVISKIEQLKSQSKTGATGFGQLSNQEGEYLKNSIANLNTLQNKEDFQAQLDTIINYANNAIERNKKLYNAKYGGGGDGGGTPNNEANERQLALDAIKQRPDAEAKIRESFKKKTGKDL